MYLCIYKHMCSRKGKQGKGNLRGDVAQGKGFWHDYRNDMYAICMSIYIFYIYKCVSV